MPSDDGNVFVYSGQNQSWNCYEYERLQSAVFAHRFRVHRERMRVLRVLVADSISTESRNDG